MNTSPRKFDLYKFWQRGKEDWMYEIKEDGYATPHKTITRFNGQDTSPRPSDEEFESKAVSEFEKFVEYEKMVASKQSKIIRHYEL